MDLHDNLRADVHHDESSTQIKVPEVLESKVVVANEVSVTKIATPESPKRGKKGKYQGQTGPRSQRGKEASRNNCKMIHGLRAKKLLMPFEDPKEYEAHVAMIVRALKPQDAVEHGIVDAYAYALWTSPRFESYEQVRARDQFESKVATLEPEKIAQDLGLDTRHQIHAPAYLVDLNHDITQEQIDRAASLLADHSKIKSSMERGDPSSLDWPVALECYPELFSALDQWLIARDDEVAVFGEDGKTLDPFQLEHPDCLWNDLESYACVLYFEANFMRLKPQIALLLERMYWKTCYRPLAGFSDHFVKSQNFAFTQLERLADYRQMKQKFEDLEDEEVEEG